MKNDPQTSTIGKMFGLLIRQARERRGLSRTLVAGDLDIDDKTIERIERGECIPSLATASLLARYFSLSLDEVVFNPPSSIQREYVELLDDWEAFSQAGTPLSELMEILKADRIPEIRDLCERIKAGHTQDAKMPSEVLLVSNNADERLIGRYLQIGERTGTTTKMLKRAAQAIVHRIEDRCGRAQTTQATP